MYKTHRYCKTYSALVNTFRPTAVMADMRYAHCGPILGCDLTLIPKPSRFLTVLEGFCDHHAVCACVYPFQFTNHLTDSRNLMWMLCL